MNDTDVSRYEAERRELPEDNKRMWEDLVRLRKWKESVEEENDQLRAEGFQMAAEMAGLRQEVERSEEERQQSRREMLDFRTDALQMRDDNARLAQEATALRQEVHQVRQENENLTSSSTRLEAELQQFKGRQSGMRKHNVALTKRLNGSLCIPMEIIVNIAAFLAGANNYGTLKNLSMMSKRVRQECLPTCFETYMPFHTNDLMATFKGAGRYSENPLPSEWKFCKYVVIPSWLNESAEVYFPQIRLTIKRSWVPDDYLAGKLHAADGDTVFTAQFTLHKSVPAEVLASLLRYPQRWGHYGTAKRHLPVPIQGINWISIEENGFLIRSRDCAVDVMNWNMAKTLTIDWRVSASMHDARGTFRELGRLPPVRAIPTGFVKDLDNQDYPTMTLQIHGQLKIQTWLESLPSTLARQPELHLHLALNETIDLAQLKKYMLGAGAAYQRVWHRIKDSKPHFTMFSRYRLEEDIVDQIRSRTGRIYRQPSASTIDPLIVEISEVLDDDDGSTRVVVYQELFAVPGGV